MRTTAVRRSSLAAVSVVCLVVPAVTPAATAGARQPVAISYRPALAALALPGDRLAAARYTSVVVTPDVGSGTGEAVVPAQAAPAEIAPSVAEHVLVVRQSGFEIVESGSGVTAAATVQPTDVANAISAFGYLVVAVPSLLFTIPIQILTNQRSAIITSLNNIITAVNTILKLFGRSIPPIPTEEVTMTAELRSGGDSVADSTETEDADGEDALPAPEESDAEDGGSTEANPHSTSDAAQTAPDGSTGADDAEPASEEEPADSPGEDTESGETTDVTVDDADDSAPAAAESAADESGPETRTDGNDPTDGDDQKGGASQPAG